MFWSLPTILRHLNTLYLRLKIKCIYVELVRSHKPNKFFFLSIQFHASQFYITIIQQDAAVRSQFYFTAALLNMFQVLATPIIRSTLTVSTASGTGHITCNGGCRYS